MLFTLSTCLTSTSTCELMVDDTMDGKDNKEKKTRREVLTLRHITSKVRIFSTQDVMCCGDGGLHESCYIFNMSGHIKYMWVGGGRHCGWQGQQLGEDQGVGCRKDVSLWQEFSSTRM